MGFHECIWIFQCLHSELVLRDELVLHQAKNALDAAAHAKRGEPATSTGVDYVTLATIYTYQSAHHLETNDVLDAMSPSDDTWLDERAIYADLAVQNAEDRMVGTGSGRPSGPHHLWPDTPATNNKPSIHPLITNMLPLF